MKITVKSIVGGVTYLHEIEESDDMQGLHNAIVLGNPPQYCHECQNTDGFRMDSNKDKDGNIYVNVICKKCGAKSKLGLYKSKGYFWHKFEKYVKGGQSATTVTKKDDNPPPPNDDLPF